MKLIDAEKIIYRTEIIADESGSVAGFEIAYKEDIDAMPTAGAHAHWKHTAKRRGFVEVFRTSCSACGAENESATPYCPHCGAKMDDEEDDSDARK